MIIHPSLIKNFKENFKETGLSMKYVKTKKYQYLICKGDISQNFEHSLKMSFPGSYVTNGNMIMQKNFRLNP